MKTMTISSEKQIKRKLNLCVTFPSLTLLVRRDRFWQDHCVGQLIIDPGNILYYYPCDWNLKLESQCLYPLTNRWTKKLSSDKLTLNWSYVILTIAFSIMLSLKTYWDQSGTLQSVWSCLSIEEWCQVFSSGDYQRKEKWLRFEYRFTR